MSTRWIDQIPELTTTTTQPPQQMQVLCLGLSRTGTMSIWTALRMLGYRTYHFKEIHKPENLRDKHLLCWREAFYAKLYGSGKPYSHEDFYKLLQRYDAVTDAPAVNFSDELIAAYPGAKVVLSTRNPERWLESMVRSYHAVLESPVFRIASILDLPLSLLSEVFELVLRDLTGGDWRSRQKLSEAFDRHNAHIRAIVPKENLLEWEPSHGWEPLCNFLGKPVPDDPFPHSNQGDDVAKGLLMYARLRIARWTLRRASWPMASVILAGASWLLWRRSLVFA
ncbi:Ava biosynthesis cluster protein [Sphaerulina musiva]